MQGPLSTSTNGNNHILIGPWKIQNQLSFTITNTLSKKAFTILLRNSSSEQKGPVKGPVSHESWKPFTPGPHVLYNNHFTYPQVPSAYQGNLPEEPHQKILKTPANPAEKVTIANNHGQAASMIGSCNLAGTWQETQCPPCIVLRGSANLPSGMAY